MTENKFYYGGQQDYTVVNSMEGLRSEARIPGPPVRSDSRSVGGLPLKSLDWLLLGISLLAAIPRFYIGAIQFIAYDGYWHIFVAQQDRWQNFLWDYRVNAHPPLYYVALKVALWFGRSLLVYRAVSLLTGVAAIYLFGRIAARIMRSPLLAVLAALAYSFALPSIIISDEVREYMLCIFFVLASYYFFLDFIGQERPDGSVTARIFFATAAMLACLTHYCAVFYLATALVLRAFVVLLRRSEPLGRVLVREAVTFVPVFAVTSYEYLHHIGAKGVAYAHLGNFYYQGNGAEALREFLLRNGQNTFNLFSPWPIRSRPAFLIVIAGLLLAWCLVLYLLRRIAEPKNLQALATVFTLGLILAEIIVASVFRKYPFGGFLRQQFVLFPFLVLCAFLLLDRLAAAVPRRATYGPIAALGVVIVAVSVRSFHAYPKMRDPVMKEQMEHFDRLFPAPVAVYVDQYNLITFFTFHVDWKWRFVETVPLTPAIDTYRLGRGSRQMLLFRDKYSWVLNFREPALYRKLAACLRSHALPSVTVFCVSQEPGPVLSAAQMASYRRRVANLSGSEGMCVQALEIVGSDVYAEFRAAGCTNEQPKTETAGVTTRIAYKGTTNPATFQARRAPPSVSEISW